MARGQSQVRVHSGVAEQSFYHAKQMGADDYLDFISFFQRDAERNKHFQKVLKDKCMQFLRGANQPGNIKEI